MVLLLLRCCTSFRYSERLLDDYIIAHERRLLIEVELKKMRCPVDVIYEYEIHLENLKKVRECAIIDEEVKKTQRTAYLTVLWA